MATFFAEMMTALPLMAEKAGRESGWVYDTLGNLRRSVLSTGNAFVSLAMAVASIIVLFSMIKLSYEVMADEQRGGFASISLWRILRPIGILFLIQSCGWFVQKFDSAVDWVTMSTLSAVTKMSDDAQILKAFSMEEVPYHDLCMKALDEAEAERQKRIDSYAATLGSGSQSGSLLIMFTNLFKTRGDRKALEGALTGELGLDEQAQGSAIRAAVNNEITGMRLLKKAQKAGGAEVGMDDHFLDTDFRLSDKNLIPAICIWIYKYFYLVIQCVAELSLMVLAICAPWMLCFSLLEPWKNGFWNFVTSYIQVSFWKVVAGCVNFCTVTVRSAVVGGVLSGNYRYMAALKETGANLASDVHPHAAIMLSAVISVAGVILLLRIDSIVSAIIPSATTYSIGGATGGAGTASTIVGGAGRMLTAPVRGVGKALQKR